MPSVFDAQLYSIRFTDCLLVLSICWGFFHSYVLCAIYYETIIIKGVHCNAKKSDMLESSYWINSLDMPPVTANCPSSIGYTEDIVVAGSLLKDKIIGVYDTLRRRELSVSERDLLLNPRLIFKVGTVNHKAFKE